MPGTISMLLLNYKYLVLVPLIFVAQPAVGMASGALARFGFFDIPVVYFVLVGTALVGDVMWYWIGYHYGERFALRFGRYVNITPQYIHAVQKVYDRYHAVILLGSKVTNGLGLAIVVLFTAGLSKVPFGRYMVLNVIGESVWSAMILGVGYFFGELYIKIENIFGRITLVVLFGLFLLLTFGFARSMSKRIQAEVDKS